MRNVLQKAGKVIGVLLLAGVVCFGYLYLNHDIGVQESRLEEDIRAQQKVPEEWTITGDVSDTVAAYVSYPEDQSDHTFSLYVNRPGLSFGWFFRKGGSLSGVERYITAFVDRTSGERAFLSMNQQQVERLEIDDGNTVQTIAIDSDQPFAIVLPQNAGNITFYDVDGNPVAFSEETV